LARELVRRCFTTLSAQGITKCHLFVFRENAAGRAFWQRIGGEERNSLVMFSFATEQRANQSPEPTVMSVTPRADARVAPATTVAHL
jgi:hypothetical protein